jgi:hypothetical protein
MKTATYFNVLSPDGTVTSILSRTEADKYASSEFHVNVHGGVGTVEPVTIEINESSDSVIEAEKSVLVQVALGKLTDLDKFVLGVK